MRIVIFMMLVYFMAPQALAATINSNCSPSGPINKMKEMISPVSFWTAALREIDQTVRGMQEIYRYNQVERRNDKIRDNLDAAEIRAMGIPQINDPETNRALAESDRAAENLDREMLIKTQQWATKCRDYANKKLGK